MANKAKADAPEAAVTLASLGLENYDVIEIHRSELKNAPYNPRVLTDEARKRLKAGLKKHGMVGTPTWNKRTGNIVGGHQRISALDALAGHANYTLKVACIDVDDAREKELNVLLNNDEAQGIWDIGKLGELLRDETIDIAGTGFDPSDVMRLFGDTMVAKANDTRFDDLALQLDKMRETFKKIDNRKAESEFYFLAVFRSGEARDAFLQQHGLPLDRYQSGAHIEMLIRGEPLPVLPARQRGSKTQPAQSTGSDGAGLAPPSAQSHVGPQTSANGSSEPPS